MPKGKIKKKKPASRKAPKKTALKKALKKKTARKKAVTKKVAKKKAARKKAIGKKAVKKTMKKKIAARKKPAALKTAPAKSFTVEPGPPAGHIPPVEEPAYHEEALGTITHYYSHLSVAVVQINKGTIKTGDLIHIMGASTDFVQKVESMEYEHQHVDLASAGRSIGILVKDHAREHDIVYLVK